MAYASDLFSTSLANCKQSLHSIFYTMYQAAVFTPFFPPLALARKLKPGTGCNTASLSGQITKNADPAQQENTSNAICMAWRSVNTWRLSIKPCVARA
jgi:hypothetical protein